MVYSFALFKHANIRYREAVCRLARCELAAMLQSLSIHTDLSEEMMGGSLFLTFECRELTPSELQYLSRHSSVVLMAEKQKDLLRPLPVSPAFYLPEDLPEVLKYKGKTSTSFTRMMINTAASLTPCPSSPELLFFDPICGKGTGCFCAVTVGMDAVGLDIDRKAVAEASGYFDRYLQYHKLKHKAVTRSETYKGHSLAVTEYQFSDTREHYLNGLIKKLLLCASDTSDSPALFRRRKADLIAADLPYGIQHAPLSPQRAETLHHFLHRVLPVWKKVLKPGGAIALSFNTLTLPSDLVHDTLLQNGFVIPEESFFSGLQHEVEQAVVRNVIFALYPEEESEQ